MKLAVLCLLGFITGGIFASPEEDLLNGNHQFSVNLYKEIVKSKPNENVVFSPFSVQTILATLASASPNSNSQTVIQIRNAVGLPRTNSDTESAFNTIIHDLNKSNDDFKVFDASKLYLAVGYSVQQWFRAIAKSIYQAEIEVVNFADSQNTADNINSWVAKKTNNKITDYIQRGEITRNTQNILVNALYVTGKWDRPFNKSENLRKKFYGSQKTSEVEMMVNSGSYEYAEDNDAQYLKMELVREGGGASVLFILPRKKDGLVQIEKTAREGFESLTYFSAKVNVTLPKFSLTSEVKLKPILQNLGVTNLFKWGLQLSGLVNPMHPYAIISDVHQKSRLEVTEWGITAASVGIAEIIVDDPQEYREFIADHPFLFQVIVDEVILYAGRVVNL